MPRTIAYIRVSTDNQADRGVSLEAQREKVRAYAALYELELVDVVEDAGQSAKSLDRPGLQRALEALRTRQADALLVLKLDRLTRSVRDLGWLVDHVFDETALLSVSGLPGRRRITRSTKNGAASPTANHLAVCSSREAAVSAGASGAIDMSAVSIVRHIARTPSEISAALRFKVNDGNV